MAESGARCGEEHEECAPRSYESLQAHALLCEAIPWQNYRTAFREINVQI